MKTCFISAPVNVNLGLLRSLLLELGFKAILPFELEITGIDFREQIEKAIRKADLCLAVLTSHSNNANVFFELGFASAKRKRIALLQGKDVHLPPNLLSFPILKVETEDKERLSTLLRQFLHQPKTSEPRKRIVAKTKPISSRANDLLHHLKNLGDKATQKELENILVNVLRESAVRTIAEPSTKDKRYDIAIWLDELEQITGNPVLIEAKSNLSRNTAKQVKRQFLERVDREVGKALLVIYLNGPEEHLSAESTGAPLLLFVSISRLLSELEQRSLGDFVRAERNRLVHGV